jgi:hypothetical protein
MDQASRYEILRDIPNRSRLYNGGTLRFGPDGCLYASLGDDNDPCSAQDTTSLRGALLRLEVSGLPDGPGGVTDKNALVPAGNPFVAHPAVNARLVWSFGLRNPARFHLDPQGNGAFIADQGHSLYEEISLADGPGLDFGWPHFEGPAPATAPCSTGVSDPPADPIFAYDRSEMPQAGIVSAGVYRPGSCATCSFPLEYDGDYFFSDQFGGFLRRLEYRDGLWTHPPPVAGQPTAIDWGLGFEEVTDFLIAPDGSLWYCRQARNAVPMTGELHRIVHVPSALGVDPGRDGREVSFAPPHPSPASGAVHFRYALTADAVVRLELFDTQGRRVRELVPARNEARGSHTASWDGQADGGRRAPAGIYLARLTVDGESFHQRLAIVR